MPSSKRTAAKRAGPAAHQERKHREDYFDDEIDARGVGSRGGGGSKRARTPPPPQPRPSPTRPAGGEGHGAAGMPAAFEPSFLSFCEQYEEFVKRVRAMLRKHDLLQDGKKFRPWGGEQKGDAEARGQFILRWYDEMDARAEWLETEDKRLLEAPVLTELQFDTLEVGGVLTAARTQSLWRWFDELVNRATSFRLAVVGDAEQRAAEEGGSGDDDDDDNDDFGAPLELDEEQEEEEDDEEEEEDDHEDDDAAAEDAVVGLENEHERDARPNIDVRAKHARDVCPDEDPREGRTPPKQPTREKKDDNDDAEQGHDEDERELQAEKRAQEQALNMLPPKARDRIMSMGDRLAKEQAKSSRNNKRGGRKARGGTDAMTFEDVARTVTPEDSAELMRDLMEGMFPAKGGQKNMMQQLVQNAMHLVGGAGGAGKGRRGRGGVPANFMNQLLGGGARQKQNRFAEARRAHERTGKTRAAPVAPTPHEPTGAVDLD